MSVKLAPSLLASDFANLGAAMRDAADAGAEWIHVDVMDGHFVPNITIGVPVVKSLRKATRLPLDVHLMIERPERYIDAFAKAGADIITVHQEATPHLHRAVQQIRSHGRKAGVAINPGTPVSVLDEILPFVDMVLVMTVNPGFGGQEFIPTSPGKITAVREALDMIGRTDVEVEVDGGISPETAADVVRAGASVLVAGAAVFNDRASVADNVSAIRAAIAQGQAGVAERQTQGT
jgi:ribulose-phosphate 3-epimerase